MDPTDVLRALREATAVVHADAERHAFVRELFGGTPSVEAYARYLRGLVEVYGVLEHALTTHAGEAGFLADPRLARRDAIAADLAALTRGRAGATPPTIAGTTYAARVRAVSGDLPRLAAHAYVRYLGDLAGGQVLGRRVQAAFGDERVDVSRMYRFEAFASAHEGASLVRVELARIGDGTGARDAMIDEALRGFALTTALFAEALETAKRPSVASGGL